VVVVDNLVNSKEESLARVQELCGRELVFHKTDLLDRKALQNIFNNAGIEAVIHFAGLKAVGESVQIPLSYYHNNITGTLVLCETMQEHGVKIWDEWATKEQCAKFGRAEGELGPVYGHQWRNFGATLKPDSTYEQDGVDQITRLIEGIKKNPDGRRHIVTGWNPKEADQVELPPCHTLFQFYVADEKLSCQLYQRSADIFLGVPFNIASYALLTHMIAQVCNLAVGDFVYFGA